MSAAVASMAQSLAQSANMARTMNSVLERLLTTSVVSGEGHVFGSQPALLCLIKEAPAASRHNHGL